MAKENQKTYVCPTVHTFSASFTRCLMLSANDVSSPSIEEDTGGEITFGDF